MKVKKMFLSCFGCYSPKSDGRLNKDQGETTVIGQRNNAQFAVHHNTLYEFGASSKPQASVNFTLANSDKSSTALANNAVTGSSEERSFSFCERKKISPEQQQRQSHSRSDSLATEEEEAVTSISSGEVIDLNNESLNEIAGDKGLDAKQVALEEEIRFLDEKAGPVRSTSRRISASDATQRPLEADSLKANVLSCHPVIFGTASSLLSTHQSFISNTEDDLRFSDIE